MHQKLPNLFSCQALLSHHKPVHQKLPSLLGCSRLAGSETDSDDGMSDVSTADEIEREENFLGRVQSYSKLMHAHTKSQLDSPATGTLPSYTKTMHAFTLNQLNHHGDLPKSKRSISQLGVGDRIVHLPLEACTQLSKLSLEEVPAAPVNTPEPMAAGETHCLDFRETKRRSMTEPIPRDFAMASKSRDFGVNNIK